MIGFFAFAKSLEINVDKTELEGMYRCVFAPYKNNLFILFYKSFVDADSQFCYVILFKLDYLFFLNDSENPSKISLSFGRDFILPYSIPDKQV